MAASGCRTRSVARIRGGRRDKKGREALRPPGETLVIAARDGSISIMCSPPVRASRSWPERPPGTARAPRAGGAPTSALPRSTPCLRDGPARGWRGVRGYLADTRSREHLDNREHLCAPNARDVAEDSNPDGRHPDSSQKGFRRVEGGTAHNETPGGTNARRHFVWISGEPGRT